MISCSKCDYQNKFVYYEVTLEKGKIDKTTKLEELQKEIKKLQIERDTLKNSRAFFLNLISIDTCYNTCYNVPCISRR